MLSDPVPSDPVASPLGLTRSPIRAAWQVERQRQALTGAIAADGATQPVEEGAYSVLQYNAPYTVPWRRRNELAIVVTEFAAEDAAASEAGATPTEGDGVVSWYDAGQRLTSVAPVTSVTSVTSWFDSGLRLTGD